MIIGHEKQWQFLKKSVELGKISHAYLFCGEQGLGKKTVAKEFIKLLQCQGPVFERSRTRAELGAGLTPHRNEVSGAGPCQRCFSCLQIERGFHPDLTLIEPINKEIQISQIRGLCWTLSLKPYAAPYKTAIIDEAENMNSEAANALLKTLEEPSGQAVLILISSHPDMLPKTIVSRTQIIKFFPVSKVEIERYLKESAFAPPPLKFRRAGKASTSALRASAFGRRSGLRPTKSADKPADKQDLKEKEMQELILISDGRPGRVIKFLSQPQELVKEKERLKEINNLLQGDLSFRFQYVKKIIDEDLPIGEILERWLGYFRKLLFGCLISEGKSVNNIYPISKLQKIIKTIENINFLVSSTNVNPKLALEMVMLEL